MSVTLRPFVVGTLLALGACDGGGGSALDASVIDGALDAETIDGAEFDAAVIDAASLDALPPDARAFDAPNFDATPQPCSMIAPQVITAPRSLRAWEPVPSFGWAAPFALDTPVPLASLWFDTPMYAGITVYASCAAAPLATGTYHRRQVDVAVAEWTDGVATDLAAGRILLDVRTGFPSPSTVQLDVRGVIVDGEACDDPLVAAGVLACSSRANCDAGVCTVAACSNGVDDDGDGLADDADPGCALANDRDESDPCATGGPCPACADTIDSDGDGAAGWPADLGCARAGDPVEHNCPDADGVIEVVGPSAYALAGAATTDHPGPLHCDHTAGDRVLHLRVPGDLSRLSFGLGQQAIGLTLYRDTCDTAPVECLPGIPGWPSMHLDDVPAGDYWLVAIPYQPDAVMSVTGTLVAGARCDPTVPAFTCPSPSSCQPASGGHRCQ